MRKDNHDDKFSSNQNKDFINMMFEDLGTNLQLMLKNEKVLINKSQNFTKSKINCFFFFIKFNMMFYELGTKS